MTFKPKQLDPKAVKTFSETEVGTLLESIDEKLDFLIEGQKTLDNRVERLDTREKRIEAKVDVLTDTVGGTRVELTELDHRVVALEAK